MFRWDGKETWESVGRLEEEKEVMAMAVYNGKLYAGTLPLANVYRYEGGATWTNTGQLDTTPDVKYRRVWSMAVFEGKLFGGTLPSGRVYALQAGANATYDHALAPRLAARGRCPGIEQTQALRRRRAGSRIRRHSACSYLHCK